jgi:hypothetical protein
LIVYEGNEKGRKKKGKERDGKGLRNKNSVVDYG